MNSVNVLTQMDEITKKAGTADPEGIAAYLRADIVDVYSGDVIGYVQPIGRMVFMGINIRLKNKKRAIVTMHENAHVAFHLGDRDFRIKHQDDTMFSRAVHDKVISRQEKEANLVAADFTVDTEDTLEAIGYNDGRIQEYRKCLNSMKRLRVDYDRLQAALSDSPTSKRVRLMLRDHERKMNKMFGEIQQMKYELVDCHYCATLQELGSMLGVNAVIAEYKLEALRLRGYDIDELELTSYENVFRMWK